jgi:predicted transglutaminase-like cysteine proteinase
MLLILQRLPLLLLIICLPVLAANNPPEHLFGYQELRRSDLSLFPQWLSVLERHIMEMTPEGQCDTPIFNQCHLKNWLAFLDSIMNLTSAEQIHKVNEYANQKEYILDMENYGIEDYWATPKQFLQNSGDCEDFAIIKLLSLKQLGFDTQKMRIVVVQDTNQRVAHAVMSINSGGDILILDNQINEVLSHTAIFHYVPVYSVSETGWWMHLPK